MGLRRFWPGFVEALVVGAVVVSASAILGFGAPTRTRGNLASPLTAPASRATGKVSGPSNRVSPRPGPCATNPGLIDCLLAATATVTLADLSVVQNATPSTVEAEDPVTFVVDVTNSGPATATGVRLRNQIPTGSQYVSASWPGCSFATGFVDCLLATVATATTRTVSLIVRPRLPGQAVNVATVSSDQTDPNPANDSASRSVTVTAPPPGNKLKFAGVAPCRVFDTRAEAGPTGGQPLPPALELTVDLAGVCGVSTDAMSVSANVTVTQPTAPGTLTVYPADQSFPGTTTIAFGVGKTRANNAILRLSADSARSIRIRNASAGTVHVLLDVSGYFVFP